MALALAVSNDPELLILDEPTSGLDPLVRRAFLESMVERAARGRTVLLSSHQISEIERVADRMAIIHGGQVRLSGSLSEMRDEVVEVTFSVTDPLAVLPVIDAPVEIFSEQNPDAKSDGSRATAITRSSKRSAIGRAFTASGSGRQV